MNEKDRQFVLCIKNNGCEDLEIRKIYEVLPDENAAKDDYIRIVDESGEDYLYPSNYFYPVELTQNVRETLLRAA
ncbi:MAG: hypothetical protein M3525_08740 [Acidobacteriota bacterium]|nr:hypothetical protein [Acidobacteriota bacterium]